MSRARTRDEARAARRDGPAGAGAAANREVRSRTGKRKSGRQSGSKRMTVREGAVRRAPKKGGRPLKGTRRPGAPKKTRPSH
jgi:hypothetical protein